MKIALAQLNYHIGHFEQNFEKMAQSTRDAKKQGTDLVIFSELAVCGYPPRDFLEFEDFLNKCDAIVERLTELTSSEKIAIIVGAPTRNPVIEGKDLHNSAWFLADGKRLACIHKTLLPTYDIFDEYRYFEPNNQFDVIEFQGEKIALNICEDLWNLGNENPLYTICPMDEMMSGKPSVIINIAASPFNYDQAETRQLVLKANSERYEIPLVYVNHVGAQTELIFDGGSCVLNAQGELMKRLPFFQEALEVIDTKSLGDPQSPVENEKTELIHDALVLGVRDYFSKLGFTKAILGLSGGIDSAVVLVLAARALGAENVMGVLMPSQFSSDHSVDDALQLTKNLGTQHEVIPIEKMFREYETGLEKQFQGAEFNIAEENIQARIRGNLLMAMSNKFGYILLNTSNKSEAAVGYGTLYGDMAGGLSVIGDLYKTEVYELARFINSKEETIPENIISKPPSAELRPNQKDSDSLPEYEILDELLFQYIEKRQGPKELISQGFDKTLVDRVLRLVNMNEYKRYQTPPVLRVSTKAFGMGRRMPIVAKYLVSSQV